LGVTFWQISLPKTDCRLAYRSSRDPLGHGINTTFETSVVPDSTRRRFLNSPLVAQLLISCF